MNFERISEGAVRIGRTGAKLHPAREMRSTEDGGQVRQWVAVICTCGVKGKLARHVYFAGAKPTCGVQS